MEELGVALFQEPPDWQRGFRCDFSIGIMDHELNISQTWSMIWLMNDMNDMTG